MAQFLGGIIMMLCGLPGLYIICANIIAGSIRPWSLTLFLRLNWLPGVFALIFVVGCVFVYLSVHAMD